MFTSSSHLFLPIKALRWQGHLSALMKNSLENFSSNNPFVLHPKWSIFIICYKSVLYKKRSFRAKSHENRVSWKRIDSQRRKIVSFQDISAKNEKKRTTENWKPLGSMMKSELNTKKKDFEHKTKPLNIRRSPLSQNLTPNQWSDHQVDFRSKTS